MPRGRVYGPQYRTGERRKTLWIGSSDVTSFTTLALGSAVLAQSLNAAALALRPFTITRTVGLLCVVSDQSASVEIGPFGAMGMAVVSEQAVAIGVTAVPTPITDKGSDLWFQYQFAAAPTGTNLSYGGPNAWEFDSRGQRKVQDGEDVVIVMENGDAAFGLSFLIQFRMLLKLH